MIVIRWLMVDCYLISELRRTSNPVSDKLFCVRVALPNPKPVALGILAHGEVSHLRHCGFRHADFSAKFRNFIGVLVHRIDADVVDNWLLWLFAPFQRTVRSVVRAAGIDVPVIARSGKWIHLPAKQIAVKSLGAFGISNQTMLASCFFSDLFISCLSFYV